MKTILGVDPGTNILGFGVIQSDGKQFKVLDYGIIRLDKLDTYEKLKVIYTDLEKIIQKHSAEVLAIEAPFFGKNAQSMLKLGRAQGVAIACAAMHGLPVIEYAPKKIKMALTGKGFSTKEQVAAMVKQILNLKKMPQTLDATDALGVAICHCLQGQVQVKTKKSSSNNWEDFIKNNPDKLL